MNEFARLKEISQKKKIVFYGMGKLAEEAFEILSTYGIEVSFFVDRKFKVVHEFLGKPVLSNMCLNPEEHFVIIIPLQYYAQIVPVLESCKMIAQRDFCKWDELCNESICFDGVIVGKHSHGFLAYSDCLGVSTKNYISEIGSFCSINKTAFMEADHKMGVTTSHEVYRLAGIEIKDSKEQARVAIGNDVWIGANTFINASKVSRIGDGAIIAAGAVVVSDVPPYAVMCGIPAKVKKYRFTPEEIQILERVQWWNWKDEEIKDKIALFLDKELFFETCKRQISDLTLEWRDN